MKTKQYILELPLFYRNHGDLKSLNKEFLELWDEVPEVLSEINYGVPGGSISVKIDWESHYIPKIKHNLINFYTIEDYFNGKIPQDELEVEEEIINLSCEIVFVSNTITPRDEEKENKVIKYYLESILFQIFLAINLSTPGAFNCYSLKLLPKKELEIYRYSSEVFESAWIESIKAGWPLIRRLKLSQTWEWITNLNLGTRQIAENRTERALFSLLNISKGDVISHNQLVWNALALEALYENPKADINKLLLTRIALFLEEPNDGKRRFRKKIRDFYHLRSRFVHGELEIVHPLGNTILDERIWDVESAVYTASETAFTIILSTLQKMINNNWTTLKFKEEYYGE